MAGFIRKATDRIGITTPEAPLPAFYVSRPWANYDDATKNACKVLFEYMIQHNGEHCVYVYKDPNKNFLNENYKQDSLLKKATLVLQRKNNGNGFSVYEYDHDNLSKFVFAIIQAAASSGKTRRNGKSEGKISVADLQKKLAQMKPKKDTSNSLRLENWTNDKNDSQIAFIRVGDCFHFMMFTYNATIKHYYVYNFQLFINDDKSIQTLEIEEVTESNTKPLDDWMKIYNETIQKASAAAYIDAQAHGQRRGDRAGSSQAPSRASSGGAGNKRSGNTPAPAGTAQHPPNHVHAASAGQRAPSEDRGTGRRSKTPESRLLVNPADAAQDQRGHQHAPNHGAAGPSAVPGPATNTRPKSRSNTADIHLPANAGAAQPPSAHARANHHVVLPADGATMRSASARPAGRTRDPSTDAKRAGRATSAERRAASVERKRAASAEIKRAASADRLVASAERKRRGGTSRLYEWTVVDKYTHDLWTAMALAVLTKPEGTEKTHLMEKLLPIVAREMFGLICESVHSVQTYVHDGKGHHASANTPDGQVFIMYKNGKYVDFFYQGSEKLDQSNAKLCPGDIEHKKNEYFFAAAPMHSNPLEKDHELFIFGSDPNDGSSASGSEYMA